MSEFQSTVSTESTVIAWFTPGPIGGNLLFNLFINDLVFFIQYCALSNYVVDYNLFSMGKNKDLVFLQISR